MRILILSLQIVLAATLVACASPSMGLNPNFSAVNFHEGVTTKNEVVSRLGLPQRIYEDKQGLTHFYYAKAAQLTGIYAGNPNFIAANAGRIQQANDEKYPRGGFEYLFDNEGILIKGVGP